MSAATLKIGLAATAIALAMFIGESKTFGHEAHHHDHGTAAAMPSTDLGLPGDSLYNLDSSWKAASGEKLELRSLRGKARVVAMLFTSCQTACPLIIQDMRGIREKLPEPARNGVTMTVFSFDRERDTPEALRKFGEKMKLEAKHWALLTPTGDGDATELAAALGVRFKKLESGDYIHSNVIFLVNAEGEVIAKKEGLMTPSDEFINKAKALR